jgi:hypothetical protein
VPSSQKVSLAVGDSFTIRNEYGIHLHVIAAEASPEESAAIFMVFISSTDIPQRDPTTIIQIGEHPYIDKVSWVRHQNILICSRKEIQRLVVQHYGQVTPELLARIQEGIEKTDRITDPDKDLFRQWKMDKVYREMKK